MREAIEKLVQEELDRANAKFPPFSSRHEGYAVLLEEVEEAEEDLKRVRGFVDGLWRFTKSNGVYIPMSKIPEKDYPRYLFQYSVQCIEELVQVAAMARKYQALLGADNEPKD